MRFESVEHQIRYPGSNLTAFSALETRRGGFLARNVSSTLAEPLQIHLINNNPKSFHGRAHVAPYHKKTCLKLRGGTYCTVCSNGLVAGSFSTLRIGLALRL